MDYAAATPANSPNSWDQFWYGNVWSVPNVAYRGLIVRTTPSSAKVTMTTIPDGTTNTLLVSEKQLNPANYFTGDWHDDQGWIDSWDPDTIRYTGFDPLPDNRYTQSSWQGYRFGGAHPGGLNAMLGDGSVRFIAYGVNLTTFNALGCRDDNIPIPSNY
jgi:prepilin-type processing-associated H-X9-DG protein